MLNVKYEATVGLEVHAELRTNTKIFCACSTAFGAPPNTHCCPVCLGLPGAMPILNRRAVELGITAGLALGCEISSFCHTDRKQYFYPDLPKGFQISQDGFPLCKNGSLTFFAGEEERQVRIKRIHIEEDAGKLIHVGERTMIDHNRCGIPLIEIVSEPDMHSGAEAAAYARALREILVAAGISDCRMQEGGLRCDVNVSVRPVGDERLGIRTEIKNINSFSFIERAVGFEIERQIALLEEGGKVSSETRRYDEKSGTTVLMRAKERAEDYRYLREPDLLPLYISPSEFERIKENIPELPQKMRMRLCADYGLPREEVAVLVDSPALTACFEAAVLHSHAPRAVLNLLLSAGVPLPPSSLAELADLFFDGVINSATAKKLLQRLAKNDFSPRNAVENEGLAQIRDRTVLLETVCRVMKENSNAVKDFRAGKRAALQALLGKTMSLTGGRADPALCQEILFEQLSKGDEDDI